MQFKCPKCNWVFSLDVGKSGPCTHCAEIIAALQLRTRPAAPTLAPANAEEQLTPDNHKNPQVDYVREAHLVDRETMMRRRTLTSVPAFRPPKLASRMV